MRAMPVWMARWLVSRSRGPVVTGRGSGLHGGYSSRAARRSVRVPPRSRDTQSSAFLSTPGTEPLYSGVAMITASAMAIASRSESTAAGAPAASRSSFVGG
jgi:hypothetical protein